MNTPHKHKDLIIAWANGAEIEYFSDYTETWSLMEQPSWHLECTYRIKPKPVQARIYKVTGDSLMMYTVFSNTPKSVQYVNRLVKEGNLQWVSDWFIPPLYESKK